MRASMFSLGWVRDDGLGGCRCRRICFPKYNCPTGLADTDRNAEVKTCEHRSLIYSPTERRVCSLRANSRKCCAMRVTKWK